MKFSFLFLFFSAAFLWSVESQAAAVGFHGVHVTHPVQGPVTMPVHPNSVGARHPESMYREGITGRVGCSFGGQNC